MPLKGKADFIPCLRARHSSYTPPIWTCALSGVPSPAGSPCSPGWSQTLTEILPQPSDRWGHRHPPSCLAHSQSSELEIRGCSLIVSSNMKLSSASASVETMCRGPSRKHRPTEASALTGNFFQGSRPPGHSFWGLAAGNQLPGHFGTLC